MGSSPVVEITAPETYDLRRRVLRAGTPSTEVRLPEDDVPGAFHLGIRADGALVACVSFSPQPSPHPVASGAATSWQFRAMAVDPAMHGAGLGRTLLLAGFDRLRAKGVEHVWANARDTALGFYVGVGMRVVGEGFVSAATGLAHHTVDLDLR
jgi:predicted N-acetyltransferase YhbS